MWYIRGNVVQVVAFFAINAVRREVAFDLSFEKLEAEAVATTRTAGPAPKRLEDDGVVPPVAAALGQQPIYGCASPGP